MLARSTFVLSGVLVVGALLGSFIGKFLGLILPKGAVHDLFTTEISAGLTPTTVDLRVLEVTLGCILRFNITSVIGILIAAYLAIKLTKTTNVPQ